MKIGYGNEVFSNETEFKEFIVKECDEQYLEDFVNDTYNGYSDNLNEWDPSDLYRYIVGDLEPLREDEDLFDYLCECYDSGYLGFDAEDYEGATTFEMCGMEFDILYDEDEVEEEEGE